MLNFSNIYIYNFVYIYIYTKWILDVKTNIKFDMQECSYLQIIIFILQIILPYFKKFYKLPTDKHF